MPAVKERLLLGPWLSSLCNPGPWLLLAPPDSAPSTCPASLQDALLSSERFRSLLLRAFRRRHAAAVDAALVAPAADPQHGSGFDSLGGYWVDPKARQLLQFAGLHALSVQLTAAQALAPAQLLPCVSRVLLTTEERKSER